MSQPADEDWDGHTDPVPLAEGACCVPARRPLGASVVRDARQVAPPQGRHAVEQVELDGGRFLMGDSYGDGNPLDGERPLHGVDLEAFNIDVTTVTNDAFALFAEETGYRTDAEVFGYSAVFHLAVEAAQSEDIGPAAGTPWWRGVRGASWRRPGGLRSDNDGWGDHPVVHVSWNDAMAYCAWSGRHLPTEAQWEYAARGGLVAARYPWGDELMDDGSWQVNIFQGEFPSRNSADDGWMTTAPVRTFAPNAFGLWQTVGNVWEWCSDWYDPSYYSRSPRREPQGPDAGSGRVLRGGSYLCHDSYCNRYRTSARSSNTTDSSMGNAGFRTVGRPG